MSSCVRAPRLVYGGVLGLWFDGQGLVEWSPTLMPWLQE